MTKLTLFKDAYLTRDGRGNSINKMNIKYMRGNNFVVIYNYEEFFIYKFIPYPGSCSQCDVSLRLFNYCYIDFNDDNRSTVMCLSLSLKSNPRRSKAMAMALKEIIHPLDTLSLLIVSKIKNNLI